MRRQLNILIVSLLVICSGAGLAHGRTWYVALDGSGDFTIIQEAVDAAEDGDVIEIGPGRYDWYQTITGQGGGAIREVYVNIMDKALTLNGAGIGQTIIGPEDPNTHQWPGGVQSFIIFAYQNRGLVLSGLTLEHAPWKLISIDYAVSLNATNCEFRNGLVGVWGAFSEGGLISDCRFENLSDAGVSVYNPTVDFRIEDSIFSSVELPVRANWSPNYCEVVNCEMSQGGVGVGFLGGASGSVTGCTILDFDSYGVTVYSNGEVLVADNVIEQTSGWGMFLGDASNAVIRDNIISTESGTILFLPYPCDGMVFEQNSLSRGNGSFAKTANYYPVTPPVYFDLRYNYWGTVDADEIAEYIIDGHDLPNVSMYVLFEPFLGGPVAVESQTWTEVKNLFRN